MWQVQGGPTLQKQACALVAVFGGEGFDKKASSINNNQPVYPFPDFVSAGRLEVHTLNNPSTDDFRHSLESLDPDFVYLQGARSNMDHEEIGSLVWGDVELSTSEAITGLFGSALPTTVYLEIPDGEKLAEALWAKGIPYVIYWKNGFSRYSASHFCHALMSVLQSSVSHIWDVFQLAVASFRLFCVRNSRGSASGQKVSTKLGPRLLGDSPRINIKEPSEGDNSPSALPAIKIYDDEVTMRFLVCGAPCTLDACLLGSLEDGLNALLNIEMRGSRLHNRISAAPPPLAAGTFSRGVVTMRCDMSTCGSAQISLLVSGSAQTCFDDQLLESHIKSELVEKNQLVHAVPQCDDAKSPLCEPRRSASIACGASTFEVSMKVPTWAAQVLRQLAPEISYRSLVALGITSVQGLAVASFEKDDAERVLFFCNKKSNDPMPLERHTPPPEWLKPPLPCRKRHFLLQISRPSMNSSSPADYKISTATNVDDGTHVNMEIEMRDNKSMRSLRNKHRLKVPSMRPIPHMKKRKLLPFARVSVAELHEGSFSKTSISSTPSSKQNYAASVPAHRQSSSSIQPPVIPLNPLPLKKHGCGRSSIHDCSEEEFLRDVMQFLILRGHTRLVPSGGLAEFPDAILNAKRLDLYNLYKEVVSRGGFNVGNGINWKGQVFSKMRNHTTTNRMTGVGNTLKRHYETYLLEYELAHDDVDGECCLLCRSSAAGDWVNCGMCGEWAHFGCDRRQGLGAFKDYAKTDGLEYVCPHCSLTNFHTQSAGKSQKASNGYSHEVLA